MIENSISLKLMKLNAFYIENYKNNSKPWAKQTLSKLYSLFKDVLNIFKAIKYSRRKTILLIKMLFNKRLYQDYTISNSTNSNIIEKELNYTCRKETPPQKIAVYTSVFGNYDNIKEPLFVSDYCDYFAITDQELPANSVWQKINYDEMAKFNELDNYHKSKFCKIFPHLFFKNYDYSIWIDGNAQIVADLYPLIDRMDEKHVMATFQNPLHNCIFTERNFLIYHNAVDMDTIDNQLKDYKEAGFPHKFGMREFTIIIRKHCDPELQNIMEKWWYHVNKYTMRDQISLPFILWETGKSIDYIQMFEGNWRYNPRFIYYDHAWRHKFSK